MCSQDDAEEVSHLTTDSSKVMEDSSVNKEAWYFKSHMFREREAKAVCMSLFWVRGLVGVELGGRMVLSA